jgi:hypothetical protein
MNERIKSLVYEAEKYALNKANDHDGDEDYENTFEDDFQEKFAELLVRECIKSLWTEECHTSDLAVEEYNRNSKKIRQHFGIES